MSNITCQNGQLTRAEYKAGIKRDLCTEPSSTMVLRKTEAGTEYEVHLCVGHAR